MGCGSRPSTNWHFYHYAHNHFVRIWCWCSTRTHSHFQDAVWGMSSESTKWFDSCEFSSWRRGASPALASWWDTNQLLPCCWQVCTLVRPTRCVCLPWWSSKLIEAGKHLAQENCLCQYPQRELQQAEGLGKQLSKTEEQLNGRVN